MRWVLHGNLAGSVAEALKRHEQEPHAVSDLGLAAEATPRELLRAAQSKQLDIFTADAAMVNAIFDEDIWFNRSIVYLQLEGGDVEQDDAVDRLFARYKRMTPSRLYTVTGSRVKVRQLPTKKVRGTKGEGGE
jgi:propanediol dehydratase small subunit